MTLGRGPAPIYLHLGGRPFMPVGAHFVPVEGPDWPWRVGPEAFDRAFAGMAAAGLDAARIDLLWSAIEPEPGRYDEAHLRGARRGAGRGAPPRAPPPPHPVHRGRGRRRLLGRPVAGRAGTPIATRRCIRLQAAHAAALAAALARRARHPRLGPDRRAALLAVPRHDRRGRAGLDARARRGDPGRRPRRARHDRDGRPGGGLGAVPGRRGRRPTSTSRRSTRTRSTSRTSIPTACSGRG